MALFHKSSLSNYLGAAFTCVPSGYLIYWIGRKWSLLLLTFPALVGWALILFAKNFLMLVLGRVVLGIAVGLSVQKS